MEATIQTTYQEQSDAVDIQLRQMVLAGLEEAEMGRAYDADNMLHRLEKRYTF